MKYEIPAVVLAYYNRIGAEVLNFRRAMVKEYQADNVYYTEKTLIKLHPDGRVTCNNPDAAPTAEEAKEIAVALLNCQFPVSILASEAACDRCTEATGQVFRFWNLERTGIIMLQSRPEGTKDFKPWVLMEDNRWNLMEPDGPLPFWKPKQKWIPPYGEPYQIMVHEGAKTAAAAEAIARDPKSHHPWKLFLSKFEHWGMIGGALAPHRSDYSELQRANAKMVVYVCDNDDPGLSVPTKFSKLYKKPMKVIRFTDDFDTRWDMADPMPAHLFRNGRYQGRPLESYMKPGTWATIHVKPSEEDGEGEEDPKKRGKGVYIISEDFAKEWYHSVKPEAYIHKDWPTQIYTETEFNNTVSPFSHVEGTGRVLRKHFGSKAVNLKYNPGMEPGVFVGDDGLYINTFAPCTINPEEGDPTPFIEFMEYFIPNKEDRFEVMRWCATLIACPHIKMTYGILVMSETQGVGKTTLGEHILAPLVGAGNVSYPNEQELVESQFNSWLAHKRLAVVNEIYAGNSSKAYNKLKTVITDHHISVHKKYQDTYDVENFIHVFACSNSKRALKIAMDDRRWLVPKITEFKQSLSYWEKLYNWLNFEGGLNIIRKWASDFVAEHGAVEHGASAPTTLAKQELIKESYSSGMMVVQRALQSIKERVESGELKAEEVFTTDRHLQARIKSELYDGKHNDKIEKPATIRMVAKEEGWCISTQTVQGAYWGPTIWGAHLISLKPIDKNPDDIGSFKVPVSERRKPIDLNQLLDVL